MKSVTAGLLAAAMCALLTPAAAAPVTMATSQPGSLTNSVAAAVAAVVSERTDIRVLLAPGQSDGHSEVNEHQADLAVGTFLRAFTAGQQPFAKYAHTNLRNIGAMMPLRGVLYVRADSDIKSLADLKGKRMYCDYPALDAATSLMKAYLVDAGLTESDVTCLTTQNVVTAADGFVAGRVDVFQFAVGAAKVKEVSAAVGGLRVLPWIDVKGEAQQNIQSILPGVYAYTEQPAPFKEGITKEPMLLPAWNLYLFANDETPDDVVYKITKAVYENKADLVKVFGGLAVFDPKAMAMPEGDTPFHPGAVKFYKEAGIGSF